MSKHSYHGRNRLLCAATVALTLAAAGCHVEKPYQPTPSTEATKALQELKSLPSLEDTKAQVQAAMDEITAAAKTLIPSINWETLDQGTSGNCEQPYEQTDGQRLFLPNAVAERVSVSEADWAQILQVAKDAAAKIGATDVQVIHDQPGNHDVWFSGPTGIFIKISYQGNLVVSGYTGCRLPGNKK
jgi:hypothetical protein